MKKIRTNLILAFIGIVNLNYAQATLENITNFCNNTSANSADYNLYNLAVSENFVLYKTTARCAINNQIPNISLWAFDGTNIPHTLKYPDGDLVDDIVFVSNNSLDILELNNKIYMNVDSENNSSRTGLYYFDENISTSMIQKVNSAGFNDSCKEFGSLVKFNGGIFYQSNVNNQCFYDATNSAANYIFSDFRGSNFNNGGGYFKNVEYNNNLIFVSPESATSNLLLKKYNISTNTVENIENSEYEGNYAPFLPTDLVKFSNKIYFVNRTEANGIELFSYDNESINCIDIVPGSASSNPNFITVVNDNLYFTVFHDNNFYIYQYNGVSQPKIIHQFSTDQPYSIYYTGLCGLNGKLYFTKSYKSYSENSEYVYKTELYSYDGSGANSQLVDTFLGFQTSSVNSPVVIPAVYQGHGLPQFSEEKFGNLFTFKGNLYITGKQMLNNNSNSTAEDIWKIKNLSLNINNSSKNIIKYYPNPFINKLTIDLVTNVKKITVEIFDNSGRFLSQNNFNNKSKIELFMPKEKGNYFIKILLNDKDVQVFKVIKE